MAEAPDNPGHFLREWRQFHGMSLEHVAERIVLMSQARAGANPNLRPMTMTHATLSRIERGLLPYNQYLMQLLAEIYKTDIASLVMRNPADPEGLWSVYDALTAVERRQVVEIAKTIHNTGRTGTGG